MNDSRIRAIIRRLSEQRAEQPLENLVVALNLAIESDFVLVSQVDKNIQNATTVAASHNGKIIDNFSYGLSNTPCDLVTEDTACVYNGDVQKKFPKDQLLVDMGIQSYLGIPLKSKNGDVLGICAALYEGNIKDALGIESLFLLFAGIIAGYLENQEHSNELEMCWSLIQGSTEAICITDLNSTIKYVNPAFEKITGYTREQAIGKTPKILHSGIHNDLFYQQMWSSISEQGLWSGEIWNRNSDGNLFLEKLSILALKDSSGKPNSYASYFSDITAFKETESLLQFEQKFDKLTKLAKRDYFLQQVNQLIDIKSHPKKQLALIIFNINQFKLINETYGRRAANLVLQHVANILNNSAHSRDDTARISGDEFALLVSTEESVESIKTLAKTLATKLKIPHEIEGVEIQFTVSIGIAAYPSDGTTAEQLLDNAYEAMLASKRQGGGTIGLFSSHLQQQSVRRAHLRRALFQDIKNGGIDAVFQPIMDPYQNLMTRVEALARWQCEGIPISPAEFIPLAEESGLIPEIGKQILEKSCQLIHQFINAGIQPPIIAINRSVHEFLALNDSHEWLDTIAAHGLSSKLFCFEITESSLASDDLIIIDTLNALRSANCSIAIDDFGIGYSSLNYLRRFPASFLKIDKEFIQDCVTDSSDHTLVSTIIAMGHALGMQIIAEGVETELQMNLLKDMQVDLIQGYYYSQPLNQSEIIQFAKILTPQEGKAYY